MAVAHRFRFAGHFDFYCSTETFTFVCRHRQLHRVEENDRESQYSIAYEFYSSSKLPNSNGIAWIAATHTIGPSRRPPHGRFLTRPTSLVKLARADGPVNSSRRCPLTEALQP